MALLLGLLLVCLVEMYNMYNVYGFGFVCECGVFINWGRVFWKKMCKCANCLRDVHCLFIFVW